MGWSIRRANTADDGAEVRFLHTPIPDAFVVEVERLEDERGFFARSWCSEEFRKMGLSGTLAQCSISFSAHKGTLRGMHYQANPYQEAKLVRCTSGTIHDVIVDIRPTSKAYKRVFAIELSAQNRKMLYVPEGVAHGFQTLEDDTEVFYQISEFYHPELARGIRWNDRTFQIQWPMEPTAMSARDREFPDFVS